MARDTLLKEHPERFKNDSTFFITFLILYLIFNILLAIVLDLDLILITFLFDLMAFVLIPWYVVKIVLFDEPKQKILFVAWFSVLFGLTGLEAFLWAFLTGEISLVMYRYTQALMLFLITCASQLNKDKTIVVPLFRGIKINITKFLSMIKRFKSWRNWTLDSKIASVILLMSIIGIGTYFIIQPYHDPYTDLYFLASDGSLDLPKSMRVNETLSFIVGIYNSEYKMINYSLMIYWDNNSIETFNIVLDHGQRWEKSLSLIMNSTGWHELSATLSWNEKSQEIYWRLNVS